MKRILVVLALVLVALAAFAANDREEIITADGGGSLTKGLNFWSGPQFVDVASNGTATIKFLWFNNAATDRADSNLAEIGPNWVLRDWTGPRSFGPFAGAPDSFFVDLGTATEVIVSW
jgi:hypothetical protein